MLLIGLATKPSAKTTPEEMKTRITNTSVKQLINTALFSLQLYRPNIYQVLLQTALVVVVAAAAAAE